MSITLTADQQVAYQALVTLVTDPAQQFLVIDGYAGTGKTTLINTFLDEWPTVVTLMGGSFKNYTVHLTATTNKAVDALSAATGKDACTIHSLLGLRVLYTGYNKTKLVSNSTEDVEESLIIIDESSFIDADLLNRIKKKTTRCKVVFLGDPCQLPPVGSSDTPVFTHGMPTVQLTQIVRQSDTSPIQALSRALRAHVLGASIPSAGVNGVEIQHMDTDSFKASLIRDCASNPGNTVRALAWTNQAAKDMNYAVAHALTGDGDFKAGDVVVLNKSITNGGNKSIPTDSTHYIDNVTNWFIDDNGIEARKAETNRGIVFKVPKNINDVAPLIKQAYEQKDYSEAHRLENAYADLRLMYASTINKSQGSTYKIVYIDLANLGKCREPDLVRRLLYVAVSRAQEKVVFTGDI